MMGNESAQWNEDEKGETHVKEWGGGIHSGREEHIMGRGNA